ncbi:MAG TPA: S28 family serine protease [Kofleriaceae bacterium]
MGRNAYPGDPLHGKLAKMRLLMATLLALAACTGDDTPKTPDEILFALRELPGVHEVTAVPTQSAGYTYFVIYFEQKVDHKDPNSETFLQEVSLLHHNELDYPMIVHTSGYWDYYRDRVVELTVLVGGNQISIEHRFFGESRPVPTDWSKLTIEQMAADQHVIVSALKTIYKGAFVTTGGSKGGMTAIYYRRFYPDDVDGTVPYVAPISFGAPDPRYAPFLDTLGPDDCRNKIRAVATDMLANRRAAMLMRAESQATMNNLYYNRVPIGPAVESSIFNLEWAFWQYFGVTACGAVPSVTTDDSTMWRFLDDISPVSDNSDARIEQFDAYYYQAYNQLGYPDGGAVYLDPYLQYTDADYLNALPTEQPPYDDGAAMLDIDKFVREDGERLLFVYGQWDPWTGGQFELGGAKDSLMVVQAEGSHSARLTRLAEGDREAAFAKLEAWTGITPQIPAQRSVPQFAPDATAPRVPPALSRALRARKLSP